MDGALLARRMQNAYEYNSDRYFSRIDQMRGSSGMTMNALRTRAQVKCYLSMDTMQRAGMPEPSGGGC